MRICQQCGKQYEKVQGISFTKYCSTECQEIAKTRYYKVGNRICKHCGKEFEVSKKHKLYCSTECERAAISEWRKEYQRNVKTTEWRKEHYTKKKGVCVNCGAEFERVPHSRDTMRFCSRKCSDAYMSEERSREGKERKRRRMFEGLEQIAYTVKICAHCGAEFMAESKSQERYCSKECRYKSGRIRENESRRKIYRENWIARKETCAHCGKEFETQFKGSRIFCSEECRKKHKQLLKHIHNGRLEGKIVDEDITLAKLIERDGGICKICGKPVDTKDFSFVRGYMKCGNNYPSIDHVIPISKGGLHSWDNIQLAHRICNSYKCDLTQKEAIEKMAGSEFCLTG